MGGPRPADAARAAKLRGALGESLAARAYRERGYALLAANYRTRQGEIDLVLEKGGMLVFCEVKSRAAGGLGTPGEAVTRQKRQRILLAAGAYMAEHGTGERPLRFDVVEVLFAEGREPQLNFIENAFTA